ncbi:hypothetical protein [Sanguibacter sp. Z1732]
MMRRRVPAVCSAIVLAVAVGVIAAGANPGAYLLTLAVVAGVLAVPLTVLGWILFGSAPTGGGAGTRATGAGSAKGAARGAGSRPGGGPRGSADDPGWSDRATAAAWRDTVIATSVVLVVVAFLGVQWRTSYVLLGVVVLALLAQAVRQVQIGRERG